MLALASLLAVSALARNVEAAPSVSPNGRHLIDAHGIPLFLNGEAPWSLIVQLSLAEVTTYLNDRRSKGINAIMVNLIENKFSNNPPHNRNGDAPFLVPDDFSTPNEAYFAFADSVLRLAADRGFTVFLAPAYLGAGGGDEGWYRELSSNSSAALQAYGRFLGQRYRNFDGIVWLNGGDYSPPAKSIVTTIIDGIRAFDSVHIHSAHCSPDDQALDVYPNTSWLALDTVYSYDLDLYRETLSAYQRPDAKAFVMIESRYENEADWSPQRIRAQSYWSALSGAGGSFFGNLPIWSFDVGWQNALGSQGSRDMQRYGAFFKALPWWQLVPETSHRVVVSGYGTFSATDYVTVAQTPARNLAVAYIPSTGASSRSITVAMSAFSAPLTASWYNPTSGAYAVIATAQPNTGSRQFITPGNNGTGTNDWVLVLDARGPAPVSVPAWGDRLLWPLFLAFILLGLASARRARSR